VIVVDEGCFFQTARGLYLLPRGFGAPVPAGDAVMDTLASFPVINGTAVMTKATEQTIRWNCTDSLCLNGRQIVYDLAHKVWSIDLIGPAAACIGQWLNSEIVTAEPTIGQLRATNSVFADNALPIDMTLRTGDVRPFGIMSEGAISKVMVLAELRSTCSMTIGKVTEWGLTNTGRVFAAAVDDYQVGQTTITDVELANPEQRQATRLQIELSESSTTEGLAFIALAIEHEQGEGLKRASPLSRVT
jgi:hypothetical protein